MMQLEMAILLPAYLPQTIKHICMKITLIRYLQMKCVDQVQQAERCLNYKNWTLMIWTYCIWVVRRAEEEEEEEEEDEEEEEGYT